MKDLDTPTEDRLVHVCWPHPADGSVVTGRPMPRKHAEALARAYARLWPERPYWLEPVAWLEPAPRRA